MTFFHNLYQETQKYMLFFCQYENNMYIRQ